MRAEKEVIGCQVWAVRRMSHQFDVLAGQKGAGLSRHVRAGIVMVNNDSSSLVCFSNFSEDYRQTNYGIPHRIDRPTMQVTVNNTNDVKHSEYCYAKND